MNQGHEESDSEVVSRHVNPDWHLCKDRLTTFKDWPRYLQPRPESLAMAGFIYTGKGDIVKCFSCHVTLKNWKLMDDPFQEHMKHHKDCVYLKSVYYGDGFFHQRGYETCDNGGKC